MTTAPTTSPTRTSPTRTLHIREWGTGDRVAVLVHGMMAESRCWWEVGPAIAGHGYRVVAVDLPGHGRSPARPGSDVESFVAALVASVPPRPELVIGHSMGAFVLAAALPRLAPARAVYVDTPFGPSRGDLDLAALGATYERAKARRTLDALRATRPWWRERDRAVEADGAAAFDVPTAVSLLAAAAGRDYTPETGPPTLMIRPDPSRYVPPAAAAAMRARGWQVRSVPGADHSVWYGKHDEFMRALTDWL